MAGTVPASVAGTVADAAELLWRHDCPGCGRTVAGTETRVHGGSPLCRDCAVQLRHVPGLVDGPVRPAVYAAGPYGGAHRAVVLAAKDHHRPDAVQLLGDIVAGTVRHLVAEGGSPGPPTGATGAPPRPDQALLGPGAGRVCRRPGGDGGGGPTGRPGDVRTGRHAGGGDGGLCGAVAGGAVGAAVPSAGDGPGCAGGGTSTPADARSGRLSRRRCLHDRCDTHRIHPGSRVVRSGPPRGGGRGERLSRTGHGVVENWGVSGGMKRGCMSPPLPSVHRYCGWDRNGHRDKGIQSTRRWSR